MEYIIHCKTAEFQTANRRLLPSRKTKRRLEDKLSAITSVSRQAASTTSNRVADLIGVVPVTSRKLRNMRVPRTITFLADICQMFIGGRSIKLGEGSK